MKNGKSYIGKTYNNVYKRLGEHIKDSGKYTHRPLYRAFNKYGLDSFTLDIIGDFPEGLLEEKEIEAIKHYNSYGKTGYNATLGGDGKRYLNLPEDVIIAMYSEHTLSFIAAKYSVDSHTIKAVLEQSNTPIRTRKDDHIREASRLSSLCKRVYMPELELTFEHTRDCANHLINADIVDNELEIKGVVRSVARACRGDRKSYKGLKFMFID